VAANLKKGRRKKEEDNVIFIDERERTNDVQGAEKAEIRGREG
jgi:hypothetical protein